MFYSEEDFQFELGLIEEYLEEDMNMTVVVYEVDRLKTNVNSIYKETKQNIRFKPPKEVPCIYEIKESETKAYDTTTNNGVYAISGNLDISVPVFMLEKYKVDIKRGDYIGVQIDTDRMVYFCVVDDGKVNTANSLYVGAYKPAWRKISCSSTSLNEFDGK